MPETETEEPDATDTAPLLVRSTVALDTDIVPPLITASSSATDTEARVEVIASDDRADTDTASLATLIAWPPLTSNDFPADTETAPELTSSDSPDTASSTPDDATRTEPSLAAACPKWNTTFCQLSKLPDPAGLDDSLIAPTVWRANASSRPSIEYEPPPSDDVHTSDHDEVDDDGVDPRDSATVVPPNDTTRAPSGERLRITTSSTSVIVGTVLVNSSKELEERHM